MSQQINHLYEFGPFRLDAGERLLLRNDESVPLTPKAFDLLLALVERHGRLLEKEDLLSLVWPDAIVEEANLSYNISLIRKALTCGENGQKYIETVPRRGYRFVASVREVVEESKESKTSAQATPVKEWSEPSVVEPGAARLGMRRSFPTSWHLLAVVLGVSLIAVAVISYMRRSEDRGVQIKSLAVLPFKPLAPNSRDEALELGMADTMITKLSNLKHLIVRPTSAVRRYTALDQDPLAAGREQGVEAVLEANYHWTGEKIRVTVRLLQVSDGAPLWAYQCDAYCNDIFTAQDIISEKVAQSLTLELTGQERNRLAKHYTENKEAYLLYLKGRFYWNKRTAEAIKKSIDYFNQAIEKDPAYALACTGLADAYLTLPVYGGSSYQDSHPKAKVAAKRALELDETLAEAHTSMALVLYFNDWNLAESSREFETAIALNPNYAFAHQQYGEKYLVLMGRLSGRVDEALAHLKRAQELDPLSLIINADLGYHYIKISQYDKAIEQLRKTLELDQNFYSAHRYLGLAFEMRGSFQEALAEYQRAYQLNDHPHVLGQIGHLYAASGRKAEALKKLDQLMEISQGRYVSKYEFAIIHAGLGGKDQALHWLERAYREHSPELLLLKVDPYLADLHSDPRFVDLVRRVGLAQ